MGLPPCWLILEITSIYERSFIDANMKKDSPVGSYRAASLEGRAGERLHATGVYDSGFGFLSKSLIDLYNNGCSMMLGLCSFMRVSQFSYKMPFRNPALSIPDGVKENPYLAIFPSKHF